MYIKCRKNLIFSAFYVKISILFMPFLYEVKTKYADMAELADAHGSGPCELGFMQVQVLLSAPVESLDTHYRVPRFFLILYFRSRVQA